MARFHEYQVVGRKLPSEQDRTPKLYRMRIFAPNDVVAKSRFWYFLAKLRKVKKTAGEIVSVNEIFEKRPEQIKNFGVWLRYDSRSGTHNMYKEYRGMSRVEAVGTCYQDMAARHRSRFGNIQIIRVSSREQSIEKDLSEPEIYLTDHLLFFFALTQVAEIAVADVRRQYIKQLLTPKLAFPLPHRLQRVQKANRSLYQAKRPSTFY
ncbi:hypothetical protein [Absidia glauca]|uniref:Large ribosomal subunit protein eL20 domain-containing protein n=1 Tax=Absidia glauca TaxID=4829 RepID=A0A168LW52_ABSGL|nr:hypothetical protein [Absidia glauca]